MPTFIIQDQSLALRPEFDTSKKRKNRKQAQKISILCGFFELFLLTNTENYDIIYLT